MDRYAIKHRSGWLACTTWSVERAQSWLARFNPQHYTDKTLRVEDFYIFDTQAKVEVPA